MPVSKGSAPISAAYLGATEITRMYLGATLVYEKAGSGEPPAGAVPENTARLEIYVIEDL